MPDYITVEVDTDAEALEALAYDYLQSLVPEWQPHPGNAETWLIKAIVRVATEVRDLASAVPEDIFRWFGANVVSIIPRDESFATSSVTFVTKDTAGYTIPVGTQVGIRVAGDTLAAFETIETVEILFGADTINQAVVVAVNPGTASSGIGAADEVIELIDALDFIQEIRLESTTGGGEDAETDFDYMQRLTETMATFRPCVVTATDAEIVSRGVPGVYRALALDNYDPADDSYGNERMLTIVATDENGEILPAPVKMDLDSMLQGMREINFIINIMDPTYSQINVSYTGVAYQGFDTTDVEARIDAALADYLSPASWGLPLTGDVPVWVRTPIVRLYEIAATINKVEGFNYLTDLKLSIHPAAVTAADVTMPGEAPLPRPGTFVGTVTTP